MGTINVSPLLHLEEVEVVVEHGWEAFPSHRAAFLPTDFGSNPIPGQGEGWDNHLQDFKWNS